MQEIREYQNNRLKRIIQYASAHVPYYRKLFSDINLDVNSFSGMDDIRKIPFLDKETIRLKPEEFVSDARKKSALNPVKTSGSTGTPLQLILDDKTVINKYAASYRAYHWAGYNLGDKMFKITDVSPDNETIYKYERSTRSINFFSNQVSAGNSRMLNQVLWKFRPKVFLGYGLSFLIMGKHVRDMGEELYSPQAIINFGETITNNVRAQIEEVFQTKLFDFYSNTENVILVHQCHLGNLHIAEDFAYQEVISENGDVIEEGTGEMVGTGFFNFGMPFIRYRTRDYVDLHKTSCECGRKSRIISNIVGRKDDYIITPEGKYQFLGEGAISNSRNIVAAQYIQEAIDRLTINLIVDENFSESEYPLLEAGLRERLGNAMKFNFRIVDALEKTRAGKTKFIISKLGNRLE